MFQFAEHKNKSRHIYGPNSFGGGFPASSLGTGSARELPKRQGKRHFAHVPSRVDSGHRTIHSPSDQNLEMKSNKIPQYSTSSFGSPSRTGSSVAMGRSISQPGSESRVSAAHKKDGGGSPEGHEERRKGTAHAEREREQGTQMDPDNNLDLDVLVGKLEEAMESIKKNEVKMQELERDNMILKQANEKKLQEVENDNKSSSQKVCDYLRHFFLITNL